MKAIIIAGGLGTRLSKYTKDTPKGMLDFLGKSLIERQIDTFRSCGINDIVIVRKHLKDKINFKDVKYVDENPNEEGNMLRGLFQAKHEFNDDIIMTYGDVIFEKRVLEKVIKTKCKVGVVVDTKWRSYWIARLGSDTEDTESLVLDNKKDNIASLGIPNPPQNKLDARYVGILKFSKNIQPKMIDLYNKEKRKFWNSNEKWYQSRNFKKGYMTDWVQHLINNNIKIKAINISHGWMEFDTNEDYELAIEWSKKDTLKRFFNPEK